VLDARNAAKVLSDSKAVLSGKDEGLEIEGLNEVIE
jgi:hypothetical protein